MLSKFIAGHAEPALLVDHALQAEREALDLAEMSLLELVTSDRLESEFQKSSRKIQENLQRVYHEDVSQSYLMDEIADARSGWLRSRVDFYGRWLSTQSDAQSPKDLAKDVFRTMKGFQSKLDAIFESEKLLNAEIAKATPPMFRLLMTKQLNLDLEGAREVWREFGEEVFKETKALPE